jgi:hydroxymethylpyrimidine pyrophosphatase-like HAD family hydrolase
MDTIYNFIYKDQPIEKGVVEIIQRHDSQYYYIALDGKIIEQIDKESYIPTLLSRKFIKQCCKAIGRTEDEFIFVMYNFYYFGYDHDPSGYFDTNDYEEYEKQLTLIKQHIVDEKALTKFKSKYVVYRYFGIDEVEDHLT